MKTIEERAHDYMFKEHASPLNDVMHQCDLKTEMQYHKDIESSYVSAAMTQQAIDIDKTIKWMLLYFGKDYCAENKDMFDEYKQYILTGKIIKNK